MATEIGPSFSCENLIVPIDAAENDFTIFTFAFEKSGFTKDEQPVSKRRKNDSDVCDVSFFIGAVPATHKESSGPNQPKIKMFYCSREEHIARSCGKKINNMTYLIAPLATSARRNQTSSIAFVARNQGDKNETMRHNNDSRAENYFVCLPV